MTRLWLIGLAALALLTGCMQAAPANSTPPAMLPTLTLAAGAAADPAATPATALGGAASGDYLVWVFSAPNPPVRGTDTFEALVTDSAGQPVSDATVSFDVDMTNMSHGKNVVTAAALGNGHYSGDIHFMMPGPWRVIVSIARGGQTTTVRFDFLVSR